MSRLKRISYKRLNSRQQEGYNLAKLQAVLADYGYVCLPLTADWHGADLIAHHVDGHDLLIQLKGRLTLRPHYRGKGLWIAFPYRGDWFLFPHDEIQDAVRTHNPKAAGYSWPQPPKWALTLLDPFRLRANE